MDGVISLAWNHYLVESDDIRMLQKFHDLHLSSHFPSIFHIQSRLLNDLNGNLAQRNTAAQGWHSIFGNQGGGKGRYEDYAKLPWVVQGSLIEVG